MGGRADRPTGGLGHPPAASARGGGERRDRGPPEHATASARVQNWTRLARALYGERVSPRLRIAAYGSAAALVLAGGLSAALVGGVTGEILTIVLISVGLAGALLLVFLEIGLGEERDLAREQERTRRRRKTITEVRRRPRLRRSPRRPE